MKKTVKVFSAIALMFTLTACGSGADSSASKTAEIDMSAYPADLQEWTGQDFIDYFKADGVFKDGDGYETWLQDHIDYWPGTPVNELAGCWDEEGLFMGTIMILSADNADTSEADLNQWLDDIKANHCLGEEYGSMPVDHLAGNVAFTFESTIMDDELLEKMLASFDGLMEKTNTELDF